MSFSCPHCDLVAKSENGLKQHVAAAHKEQAAPAKTAAGFACPHCSTVAKSESGLRQHIALSHAQRADNEILVDGRKRIKTIQDEFTALHPHLGLHFFTLEEHAKTKNGESIMPLGGDLTLASARANAPASASGDFRINGRMHVATLEEGFRKHFGLVVQVCQLKDSKGYYTTGAADAMSLDDLDARSAQAGYQKWSYATWRK